MFADLLSYLKKIFILFYVFFCFGSANFVIATVNVKSVVLAMELFNELLKGYIPESEGDYLYGCNECEISFSSIRGIAEHFFDCHNKDFYMWFECVKCGPCCNFYIRLLECYNPPISIFLKEKP